MKISTVKEFVDEYKDYLYEWIPGDMEDSSYI